MTERIRTITGDIRFPLETRTLNNKNYRKVIFTGQHLQVVLMSLKPGEEIGREIHPHTDQFFRIEKGRALFMLTQGRFVLQQGEAAVVPAKTWHNVKNDSNRASLKLYTIYAPPKHPAGTIERSKPSE